MPTSLLYILGIKANGELTLTTHPISAQYTPCVTAGGRKKRKKYIFNQQASFIAQGTTTFRIVFISMKSYASSCKVTAIKLEKQYRELQLRYLFHTSIRYSLI